MMWRDARWLKLPQSEIATKKIYHGDMAGRFAYYRCEIELPASCTLTANITANSRYRLWVNEKPVLSGPCKGDAQRHYYETVELSSYLVSGKNAFCVQVLYCDPDTAEQQTDERASIYGVIAQRCGHRLAVEGDIHSIDGVTVGSITTGKADWYVWLDNSFYLKSSDITRYLGAVVEEIDFALTPVHWKEISFDTTGWPKAEPIAGAALSDMTFNSGVQPKFRLREREIPLLYEKEAGFVRDFSRIDGKPAGLLEKGSVTVAAGQTLELILDAGAVKNGYPSYQFWSGQGGIAAITYLEKFGGPDSDLRRTDYENGEIVGLTDTVQLTEGSLRYEPFWVRCFRFVRITIQAAGAPVTLYAPGFRQTGYPIQVGSFIRANESWVEKLWQICVRTLENCMMETYMDCPYYEQLQFAMDTRLEALFTYAVSNDHALARKALIDFHYGMQPEGLTAGKYPSVYLQILSTFSLHYIFMLWEYYQQTGDGETIRLCRGDIDRILDYYDAKIGLDGLVGRLGFWEFVDWQDAWMESAGMPKALQTGPSTIINLMYAYALSCGSQLFAVTGRPGLAKEYDGRRSAILGAVQKLCWDEKRGMYREGPAFPHFSQHAQAWAILNDMVSAAQARDILTQAIQDNACLKCSFSTAYEWFRALGRAGMYTEMRDSFNDWIGLLNLDCTTCPETPSKARSDCHAWSALPMYEMMRTMAGIKGMGVSWETVRIEPHPMELSDLEGQAITPKGPVSFCYHKNADGRWNYRVDIPDGVQAEFVYPDGRTQQMNGGAHIFEG